ncbi:hypothetical protein [Natrarchaeobius chitinivorans]|nr:hypothetical protein [Natrarchaeobius chitinivorans]
MERARTAEQRAGNDVTREERGSERARFGASGTSENRGMASGERSDP